MSTAAVELVNNLLLNEKIWENVLTSEGFKKQLRQLFRICNAFIDRAMNPEIRTENPLEEKIYPPPTPEKPLLQVPY